MCNGLLLIQWFSLGFLLIFFFGGTQHHKMRAWVLLICMDFRRKFINLVTKRPCSIFFHWLITDPAAMDTMEKDWNEPEFQDTEFNICPVLMDSRSSNIYSQIFWELNFVWEIPPCHICIYIRRKFRSETSDNMDSWKAEVRRVRREKIRRKKMQVREKVGTSWKHWKSRFIVFFQWLVAPEGRKVGSLKRRVRRQLARWEIKKCMPLWREVHLEVKSVKNWRSRTTFGSWDVEKVHAVVARNTFPSQNVQNTPAPDHFWKLRCRKSPRRCGAKHISKSKVLKIDGLGPLFDVQMSKKCTPLWREAYFQIKSVKNWWSRTTFWRSDVEKVHAVVARSTFPSQKC